MLQHKLSVCEIYFLFHSYFLHRSTRKNVTMDIQRVKNELIKQLCSMPACVLNSLSFMSFLKKSNAKLNVFNFLVTGIGYHKAKTPNLLMRLKKTKTTVSGQNFLNYWIVPCWVAPLDMVSLFFFRWWAIFLLCTDINECTTHKHKCSQLCHNSDGSYKCSCRPGFTLSSDGVTCNGNENCYRVNGKSCQYVTRLFLVSQFTFLSSEKCCQESSLGVREGILKST